MTFLENIKFRQGTPSLDVYAESRTQIEYLVACKKHLQDKYSDHPKAQGFIAHFEHLIRDFQERYNQNKKIMPTRGGTEL